MLQTQQAGIVVSFKKETLTSVFQNTKKCYERNSLGEIKYIDYKWKIEFGKEEYDNINKLCKEKGLDWSASVWDYDSLDFLLNNFNDIPFLKIPSAVNGSYEFLKDSCKTKKPIMVSLGMTELKECDKIVDILEKHSSDFCIMHTNSAYPTPNDQINLSLIPFYKRYNCQVGYSGHEIDLEPSVIASCLGANIIERHVTLDHSMWGSDHKCSLEVHAMNMLRKRIISARESIGKPIKKILKLRLQKLNL